VGKSIRQVRASSTGATPRNSIFTRIAVLVRTQTDSLSAVAAWSQLYFSVALHFALFPAELPISRALQLSL
jgi:hypothetical protein